LLEDITTIYEDDDINTEIRDKDAIITEIRDKDAIDLIQKYIL